MKEENKQLLRATSGCETEISRLKMQEKRDLKFLAISVRESHSIGPGNPQRGLSDVVLIGIRCFCVRYNMNLNRSDPKRIPGRSLAQEQEFCLRNSRGSSRLVTDSSRRSRLKMLQKTYLTSRKHKKACANCA